MKREFDVLLAVELLGAEHTFPQYITDHNGSVPCFQ